MSDLQPYYLNEGKRLLDTLLSIGLVGVGTENDYNAISKFLGEELQAVADMGMRRATMKLRRERLLAEQQEQGVVSLCSCEYCKEAKSFLAPLERGWEGMSDNWAILASGEAVEVLPGEGE